MYVSYAKCEGLFPHIHIPYVVALIIILWNSRCGSASGLRIQHSVREDEVWSLTWSSRLRIRHCCELWRRPAVVALIQPLAWQPPYALGAALKRQQKKNRSYLTNSVHLNLDLFVMNRPDSFWLLCLHLVPAVRSLKFCHRVRTALKWQTWFLRKSQGQVIKSMVF